MPNKISLMDAMELWEISCIYVMSIIDCNSSCFTLEANYMVSQKKESKNNKYFANQKFDHHFNVNLLYELCSSVGGRRMVY